MITTTNCNYPNHRYYSIYAPTLGTQVRIFDWDADGSHDLIGEFYTTLGELIQAASENKKVCMYVCIYHCNHCKKVLYSYNGPSSTLQNKPRRRDIKTPGLVTWSQSAYEHL